MLWVLRLLNLRYLRRQPLRALIAILSVAAGTSLVTSVIVVQTSVERSLEEWAESLAGPAPLRVIVPAARGGLDASALERVEAVRGVDAAIPLVQTVTYADDGRGERTFVVALGFDCRIEAIVGEFGCTEDVVAAGAEARAMLISPHLARHLGPDGVLYTNAEGQPVGGALVSDLLAEVNDGRAVAFPLPAAQELFTRPAALDVIYILPEPGEDLAALRERVADAAGAHNIVLRATDPPPDIENFFFLIPLGGMVSVLALAIGAGLFHITVWLSLR
jgi:putative ABC transport system permease protein